jgi:plastocyanin
VTGADGIRRRAALLLAGAAAATMTVTSLPSARAAETSVAIGQRDFNPNPVTVRVGDTVTWRNSSDDDHNVRGGPVDSPVLHPGNTFSYTFTKAGTINYVCDLHPMMQAKIVVS